MKPKPTLSDTIKTSTLITTPFMRLRIAVTDNDWFRFLRGLSGVDEVNFWKPGGEQTFKALAPNEPLLFKLHSPENFIVGGGFCGLSAALHLAQGLPRGPKTLDADKGYDSRDLVLELRELGITPHVAQNTSNRRSAVDRRTTRHPGYAISQRIRKRIEEGFGWIKEVALQRRARHRGKERVGWQFTLAAAA